jgi:type I site-specific restriction-modification system R (restriction) subunit
MQIANPLDVVFKYLMEDSKVVDYFSKNELEKILSIFDQSNRSENFHILNVKEEEFPEKYKEILRRLQKAASEPEMRKKMSTEDDIMEQFNDLEELLEKKEIELEEERKLREEKERMVEEEKKLREEKEKALELALRELENLKNQLKK